VKLTTALFYFLLLICFGNFAFAQPISKCESHFLVQRNFAGGARLMDFKALNPDQLQDKLISSFDQLKAVVQNQLKRQNPHIPKSEQNQQSQPSNFNHEQPPTFQGALEPILASLSTFKHYVGIAHLVRSLQTGLPGINSESYEKSLERLEQQAIHLDSASAALTVSSKSFYLLLKEIKKDVNLTPTQRLVLDKLILESEMAGVHLPDSAKNKVSEIKGRISELKRKYSEQYLNRLNTEFKLPLNTQFAQGAPVARLNAAREAGHGEVFQFTLSPDDIDQTHFVLQYALDPSVRENFWKLFTAGGKSDNSTSLLIKEMVNLRVELAKTLHKNSFSELVLYSQMIGSVKGLTDFVDQLEAPYLNLINTELRELQELKSKATGSSEVLQPWDVQFYIKLAETNRFGGGNVEQAQPYFEFNRTLKETLKLVGEIYQIKFKRSDAFATWHSDVLSFEVYDLASGKALGFLLVDFLSRPEKPKGGAFMSGMIAGGQFAGPDGQIHNELPVAYVTVNVARPASGPILVPFRNLQSVPHEIGHAIHGLSYQLGYPLFSGVSGEYSVRDFTELPSQLLENWIFNPAILKRLGRHYQTGEVMPQNIIDIITGQRKLFPGLRTLGRRGLMTRYDLQLHGLLTEPLGSNQTVDQYLMASNPLWNNLSYLRGVTRIENNPYLFKHGYESQFHAYQHSEALEASLFDQFLSAGLENAGSLGLRFRQNVLSQGSLGNLSEIYWNFTGGTFQPSDILKKYGAAPATGAP
jgi:Zn-dependent oligopeptidase